MKLTKSKLKQIIKEELGRLMNEEGKSCEELKKDLSIIRGQIQVADPMDPTIPNMVDEEKELKEKIKAVCHAEKMHSGFYGKLDEEKNENY